MIHYDTFLLHCSCICMVRSVWKYVHILIYCLSTNLYIYEWLINEASGLMISLMITYCEYRMKVTTHQFMLLLHLVDFFCVFLVDLFELSHHTLTALAQGLLVIDKLRTGDSGVANHKLYSFSTFYGMWVSGY